MPIVFYLTDGGFGSGFPISLLAESWEISFDNVFGCKSYFYDLVFGLRGQIQQKIQMSWGWRQIENKHQCYCILRSIADAIFL